MDKIVERHIGGLLWKTFELARNASFSIKEYGDLILTVLLWKYLSEKVTDSECQLGNKLDESNFIDPDDNTHLKNVLWNSNSSNITENCKIAIEEWINKNPETLKDLFKPETLNSEVSVLYSILKVWESEFDMLNNSQFWCDENIKQLFKQLTTFFAEYSPNAHQMYTPLDVVDLLANSIDVKDMQNIYDPFCRSGALLNAVYDRLPPGKKGVGVTPDSLTYRMAKIESLMLRNNLVTFELNLSINSKLKNEKYDLIVTNPSFGYKSRLVIKEAGEWSNKFWSTRIEISFLTHILDSLSENGRAAIVVPAGILFNKGNTAAFREKLIEDNILEAVISLPPKLFYQTGVASAILLLDCAKKTKDFIIINAEESGQKQRSRHILHESDINKLTEIINAFRKGQKSSYSTSRNSIILSNNDLQNNDYSLKFSKYIQNTPTKENQLRASSDILKECMALEADWIKLRGRFDVDKPQ